jgi:hypothetical protein
MAILRMSGRDFREIVLGTTGKSQVLTRTFDYLDHTLP